MPKTSSGAVRNILSVLVRVYIKVDLTSFLGILYLALDYLKVKQLYAIEAHNCR
jgi:hypothetical protein